VSAPLVATQSPFVVDLSLDASIATQEGLDATNAQLLATKNNVNTLFASSAALSGEVDALAVAVAGKQSQLSTGTVAGGFSVLGNNGIVRALQAVAPLKIAPDTQFLQIRLDQAELAATPAIAALQTDVAGKQSQLSAGTVEGGHPLLLPGLTGGGFFEPGQTPQDTIRALKVSSPLVATSDNSAVHVSLDPGWSPYWVCGIFDGNDLTKLADTGRYPFTVTRPSGTTVGVFRVSWSTPHPQGVNYIIHTTAEFGVAMIRRRTDGPNTSTSFDCFCRDSSNLATNANRIIHFSVVV
jgi:hypothetical protein